MRPRVFIPEPIAASGMELLRRECECLAPWDRDSVAALPEDQGSNLLHEADAAIVRLFRIDRRDIEDAGQLKVIAKHGVGVDNVDCAAATKRGIPVLYTPTANANAVAEHTVCLMLALARKLGPASQALREGRFSDRTQFPGIELLGKGLGIIGLGRIGTRVAEIAALGFGMQVYAYDPFLETSNRDFVILKETLDALLEKADFLSLHVPFEPQTRHLINAKTLKRIKPGGRLINTSRGGVIDEAALVEALEQGRLAGAALDVFEEEPLPSNHLLCRAPNIFLTPHISSTTAESLERMSYEAAQGVLQFLKGRRPDYVINPEVFSGHSSDLASRSVSVARQREVISDKDC